MIFRFVGTDPQQNMRPYLILVSAVEFPLGTLNKYLRDLGRDDLIERTRLDGAQADLREGIVHSTVASVPRYAGGRR